MNNSAPIVHTSSVRVRYAETDKMGVVYNGNYLAYFELGRTELLRSIGLPYAELECAGYMLPVLEAKVRYNLPAYYDDLLDIETTFRQDAAATIQMNYRLLRAGIAIAEGYTLHAFISSETRRAVRPPRIFLDVMNSRTER